MAKKDEQQEMEAQAQAPGTDVPEVSPSPPSDTVSEDTPSGSTTVPADASAEQNHTVILRAATYEELSEKVADIRKKNDGHKILTGPVEQNLLSGEYIIRVDII